MLKPKNTKFRKSQKKCIVNNAFSPGIKSNIIYLKFGKFGVKALESGILSAKTIEAVRRTITRKFKRNGKIWITIFPDIPVTQKPLEVRMGKGKGAFSYWIAKIKAGQILFEMDGVSLQLAKQAFKLADYKLPIKTEFILN